MRPLDIIDIEALILKLFELSGPNQGPEGSYRSISEALKSVYYVSTLKAKSAGKRVSAVKNHHLKVHHHAVYTLLISLKCLLGPKEH